MENEIERLEKISDFYKKGDLMDEVLVEREIELIKKSIDVPGKAIEIGCGNGYSTERLVKIFSDLIVLEPSSKNLDLMKARLNTEITSCHGLLEEFKTDKKFDHVIFLNVLEHVEDPLNSLKNIEALLTDEGLAFVSVPNCMSLNRRAGYKLKMLDKYDTLAPKDHDLGHRRLYTVQMLTDQIEASGLKVVSMKGVYLKPLSESQMAGLGIETIKAFYSLGEDIPHYCANLFAVVKKRNY